MLSPTRLNMETKQQQQSKQISKSSLRNWFTAHSTNSAIFKKTLKLKGQDKAAISNQLNDMSKSNQYHQLSFQVDIPSNNNNISTYLSRKSHIADMSMSKNHIKSNSRFNSPNSSIINNPFTNMQSGTNKISEGSRLRADTYVKRSKTPIKAGQLFSGFSSSKPPNSVVSNQVQTQAQMTDSIPLFKGVLSPRNPSPMDRKFAATTLNSPKVENQQKVQLGFSKSKFTTAKSKEYNLDQNFDKRSQMTTNTMNSKYPYIF